MKKRKFDFGFSKIVIWSPLPRYWWTFMMTNSSLPWEHEKNAHKISNNNKKSFMAFIMFVYVLRVEMVEWHLKGREIFELRSKQTESEKAKKRERERKGVKNVLVFRSKLNRFMLYYYILWYLFSAIALNLPIFYTYGVKRVKYFIFST